MDKQRHLTFDLMKPIGGGRETFIATMKYPYSPMWKFDFNALYEWIVGKRPSLKGKPFNVYLDGENEAVIHYNQEI